MSFSVGRVSAAVAAVALAMFAGETAGWAVPQSSGPSVRVASGGPAGSVSSRFAWRLERSIPGLPPPGEGTGPGYCTGYPGGVASSYSFDSVYACQGTTTGVTTFDNPGQGYYAWQCVELSARFLWAVYGIWAGPDTKVPNGALFVSWVHDKIDPQISVGTPGPGSVPVAGDVISFGPGPDPTIDPSNGHTAIVIASDASTGKFTVMSQNYPDGKAGEQTAQVDLSGGHNGYVDFNGAAWTKASWLKLTSGHFSYLESVKAVSPTNAWAVGFYCSSNCGGGTAPTRYMILHWNGQAWSRTVGGSYGSLSGVSATSASDAWAVGSAATSNPLLFLHWNGMKWSRVTSATPGVTGLGAVYARTASDAWAVGGAYSGSLAAYVTAIVHWNGHTWSRVASPAMTGRGGNASLSTVSADSAKDAWAAGNYCTSACSSASGYRGVILHWNGSTWAKTSLPVSNSFQFTAVSALAPGNVWALGMTINNQNFATSLMLHWNGTKWSEVSIPNDFPTAMTFTSPANGWAIGLDNPSLHWNGSTWKEGLVPMPNWGGWVAGASGDTPSDVWVVGAYCTICSSSLVGLNQMILHWNGTTWSRF